MTIVTGWYLGSTGVATAIVSRAFCTSGIFKCAAHLCWMLMIVSGERGQTLAVRAWSSFSRYFVVSHCVIQLTQFVSRGNIRGEGRKMLGHFERHFLAMSRTRPVKRNEVNSNGTALQFVPFDVKDSLHLFSMKGELTIHCIADIGSKEAFTSFL